MVYRPRARGSLDGAFGQAGDPSLAHPSVQGRLHALALRDQDPDRDPHGTAIEADALLGGAIKFEGEMLDPPMFGKALQTLLKAHALHALSDDDTAFAIEVLQEAARAGGPRELAVRSHPLSRGELEPSRMALGGPGVPEHRCGLHRRAPRHAQPRPAIAMIVEDDALGTSLHHLRASSPRAPSRFAQLLRDLGVAAGDRVLVRLPNSHRLPHRVPGRHQARRHRGAHLDAAHRRGSALPARGLGRRRAGDRRARPGRRWARSSRATRRAALGHVTHRAPARLDLEAALAAVGDVGPAERTRADDPAYLVYTSGTTGYPKGVLHGHRSLIGRMPAGEYWFDFARGERPHPALGQVQLDLRARLRAHGPALPRQDRDRARGPQRRRDLAAAHRQARRHDLHRRADDLPPDPAEDRVRAAATFRRCAIA